MATTTRTPDTSGNQASNGPFPEFVDWAVALVIALGGLIWIGGGSVLTYLVDRAMIAEGIEGGTVTVSLLTTDLTEAQMLEVTSATVTWTGIGLMLVGLGMVLFAIGYTVRRHRTHRRYRTDGDVSSYGAFAVLGAVVSVFLSFLPFSPAVGGALAGYLERGESERLVSVGTLSGLLAALPFIGILLFAAAGLVAGLLAIEQFEPMVFVGTLMFLTATVGTAISAGLGALGGYVGGRIAESRTTSE